MKVSACLLLDFAAATSMQRGIPHYVDIGTMFLVEYRVSTLFGVVNLKLDFPGIYRDSYPSDFDKVSSLVNSEVDEIFMPVRRKASVFTVHGPLAYYHGLIEAISIDPTVALRREDVNKVIDGLSALFKKVTKSVYDTIVSRISLLGDYEHPFELLLGEWKECNLKDSVHGALLFVDKDHIELHQEFTDLSLSVWSFVKRPVSLKSILPYFEHSNLNMQISSFHSEQEGGIIGAYPTQAKKKLGDWSMRVSIDYSGRITVNCKKASSHQKIVLSVGDRNLFLQKRTGLGNQRFVNWANVEKICGDLFRAFY